MSHFTTIKTQIKNKEALVSALNVLGLAFEESGQLIELNTNWLGNTKQEANLVIRGSILGCGADVGFKFDETEKSYQIIADDWELRRCRIANFRQKLIEEYTVSLATHSGYRVVSRTVDSRGRMQLELEANQVSARR